MKIADARAVITGGASGLGLAVARHITMAGGRVTLLDVRKAPGRLRLRHSAATPPSPSATSPPKKR